MVLIMIWRPRGLIATREPSVLLSERRRTAPAPEPSAESVQGSLAPERQT
jgi:hypothetical protein